VIGWRKKLPPFPQSASVSSALLLTYAREGIAVCVPTICPTHYKWGVGYYGGSVTIQADASLAKDLLQVIPRFQQIKVSACSRRPIGSITLSLRARQGDWIDEVK
jgi:hypothetical protein